MNVTFRSADAGLYFSRTFMRAMPTSEDSRPTTIVMIGSAVASTRFAAYSGLVAAIAMLAITAPT